MYAERRARYSDHPGHPPILVGVFTFAQCVAMDQSFRKGRSPYTFGLKYGKVISHSSDGFLIICVQNVWISL